MPLPRDTTDGITCLRRILGDQLNRHHSWFETTIGYRSALQIHAASSLIFCSERPVSRVITIMSNPSTSIFWASFRACRFFELRSILVYSACNMEI